MTRLVGPQHGCLSSSSTGFSSVQYTLCPLGVGSLGDFDHAAVFEAGACWKETERERGWLRKRLNKKRAIERDQER